MTTTTRLAALALSALLVAGCSAGGGDSGADPSSAEVAAGGSAAYDEAESAPADRGAGAARSVATDTLADVAAQRAVISTGTVSLVSDDVEAAVFDVRRVVDEARGEVSDEQTGTDRDGEVRRSRLVLRVPAAAFDETMTALKSLEGADLRSAKQTSEDVTTQVIDVAARVRAQEASLARVELLFARAQQLRDVVAIEAQLSRRQAELDSLKQQQAYLADQTTLSTVTVLVERPAARPGPDPEDDGFVAGLGAGWDALQASTVAVLTAIGAVLPFLVVVALLGVPAWLVLRRVPAGTRERGAVDGTAVSGGAAGRTP